MMELPIVSIMIFLPVITGVVIMLLPSSVIRGSQKDVVVPHEPPEVLGSSAMEAKLITIISSLISLALSIYAAYNIDIINFTEYHELMQSIGFNYHVGLDGLSIIFVMLTNLLTLSATLISMKSIKARPNEYLVCFLLLQSLSIGFFCSMNLLLFYCFFEATLIPMYIIIGVWGGENRVYAAVKFFLYTFAGSVFFLVALIFIYKFTGTFDMQELTTQLPQLSGSAQKWLWLGTFIAFAVKIPMFPLHTWLPDAHVQAPTAGSVMLAGILLKIGGYGMLKISLSMLPAASQFFAEYVIIFSAVAIIYGSLVAMAQTDMKKMIAYSSVAHMGYVTAGIFSLTEIGIQGAIFQMISHGIVSAGLFLVVGTLYERHHTKEIAAYGGWAAKMPVLASIFMIYMLGSVGLPGTSGFIGEFFSLVGIFDAYPYLAVAAASGVVLGAVYMLRLYRDVMFGEYNHNLSQDCYPSVGRGDEQSESAHKKILHDLKCTEVLALLPLALLVIGAGIYPKLIMQFVKF